MVETCHQRVKGKITDDNCDSPTILALSSLQWLTPLLNRVHATKEIRLLFSQRFPSFSGEGKVQSILSGQNWESALFSQRGLKTDINFLAVKDDHCLF